MPAYVRGMKQRQRRPGPNSNVRSSPRHQTNLMYVVDSQGRSRYRALRPFFYVQTPFTATAKSRLRYIWPQYHPRNGRPHICAHSLRKFFKGGAYIPVCPSHCPTSRIQTDQVEIRRRDPAIQERVDDISALTLKFTPEDRQTPVPLQAPFSNWM